ncbi:MAG TPA: glycosyltransferase family 39 protein [Rhizomicrobium sp.]|nr:glycosyltransferase family 39 protein [Rhizomicrobium sp.]
MTLPSATNPQKTSFLQSDAHTLAHLILAQLLIWTLVPWFFAVSLPLDVVSDGLGWGHEWQWGYFKHPPLPSWTVEAFFDVLGDIGPFLLSQIAIAITYAFVFLIGREMMPSRQALIATLLLVGVYYFSIPTPEWNHNVAQMPVWAWATYSYLRAIRTGGLRWWAMLGLACGMAVLTKYASAVLFLAMLAHLLSTRKTAAAFATFGPYLALAVLLAVIAPHLTWLVQNHFPTFSYAAARAGHGESALHRIIAPFHFLLSQLATLLPALIVAAAIGLLRRVKLPSLDDENFRFLVFLGLGPALITALLSLLSGFGIRDMWGAPMWNLTGLLIVYAMQPRWAATSERQLYIWVAALFVIMPLAYVLSTAWVPEWRGKPSRTQWPDRAMAQEFAAGWSATTHRPLDIVAGDGWTAGLIAMRLEPRASVYIDGDPRHAPWITPQRLAREGALVVWQTHANDSPPATLNLPGMRIMGVKSFPWPREPRAKPLRIGWGIVPPSEPAQ